jgi:hypothetical protein
MAIDVGGQQSPFDSCGQRLPAHRSDFRRRRPAIAEDSLELGTKTSKRSQ